MQKKEPTTWYCELKYPKAIYAGLLSNRGKLYFRLHDPDKLINDSAPKSWSHTYTDRTLRELEKIFVKKDFFTLTLRYSPLFGIIYERELHISNAPHHYRDYVITKENKRYMATVNIDHWGSDHIFRFLGVTK